MYQWTRRWLPLLGVFVLLGFLGVACGGESQNQCESNGDCKKQGENYKCSLKDGVKTCVKSDTGNTCGGATCGATQKCVNDKCVDCAQDTDCSTGQKCDNGTCKTTGTGGCNPACGTGEKCVNDKCVQCQSDTDCQPNQACDNNGKCVDKNGCNPPCPSGQKCVNQACVECEQDTDCQSGQTCNSGKCEAKSGCNPPCPTGQQCINNACVQCVKDQDCAATETCTNGKCVAKPPACNPPCQSGETCVNNKCVQCQKDADCQSGQTCDSNGKCVAQSGCNPPCASGQKCVNNACVECTQDADCASTETCTNGKCTPKTPPQCSPPCQSGQQCVNGQCVQCAKDADCPSGQKCQSGSCVAKTCVSNNDCNPGETCTNGACISPVGKDCSNGQQCSPGFICLQTGTNQAYCFQDCSGNQTACAQNTADGRTNCAQVATSSTGSPISVCLKFEKKGGKCAGTTWSTTGQALCENSTTPPLYCSTKGLCEEFKTRTKAGEKCNKSNDTTEPRYLCDSKSNLVCSETSGTCVAAVIAKEGEPCDTQGTVLGKPTICDPKVTDLICINFDQASGLARCQKQCDPQKAGQCSYDSNLTCWGILQGGQGICYDVTCTQDSDCGQKNYSCIANPIQGASGKICWPNAPAGPKAYGELCTDPIVTKGCKAGSLCLKTNDDNGFCTQDCTSSSCPTAKDASGKTVTAKCETFGQPGQTFKRCVFPCGGTGQTCPKGLTYCQEVTNAGGTKVKFCAPPLPVGPNDQGALCDLPTATKGCKKDLFCLRATGTNKGYCSRDCTSDNKCATFKDSQGTNFALTCTGGLISNIKVCVVTCGQPGQSCPTGTTCTPIGTNSICLVP